MLGKKYRAAYAQLHVPFPQLLQNKTAANISDSSSRGLLEEINFMLNHTHCSALYSSEGATVTPAHPTAYFDSKFS